MPQSFESLHALAYTSNHHPADAQNAAMQAVSSVGQPSADLQVSNSMQMTVLLSKFLVCQIACSNLDLARVKRKHCLAGA